MTNQDNKQTDRAGMSGELYNMLRQIQDLNSQLEMIESRKTKARDGHEDYEYHDGYKTCTRGDYKNSHAYDWRAAKKEEITCKFRLTYPNFDSYTILVFLVIV